MLEDLQAASENFRSALAHYLSICCSVRRCVSQGDPLNNRSLELADQIRKEADSFSQYELQFQDAKIAIKVARNNVPSIAPINLLPPEILVNIFHLVLTLRPHSIDHLAQICSRWRSIALGTYSLWTQIQFNPPQVASKDRNLASLKSGLLDHAKLHLCRSGNFPLHLYLSMGENQYEWYSEPIRSLLKCTTSRIHSLQLRFSRLVCGVVASSAQGRVLSDLLLNCEQGTFNKLVISSLGSGFVISSGRTNANALISLDLTPEQLDNAFKSIRVLHLDNLFLDWKSTAYHNLIDLRLVGSNKISDSTLVAILKMSPCLRIFHFGLSLHCQAVSDTDSPSPVELVDLEILRVVGNTTPILFHEEVEHLFSLISPGKKVLHLFLENRKSNRREETDKLISMKYTRTFIKRSNMAEVHAKNHALPLELTSWPITSHVALYRCNIHDKPTLIADDTNHDTPSLTLPLKTLYLCCCSINLDSLRSRLQQASVQRLILHDNRYLVNGRLVPQDQLATELSTVCPTVVLVDEMPACVSNWLHGVFDTVF